MCQSGSLIQIDINKRKNKEKKKKDCPKVELGEMSSSSLEASKKLRFDITSERSY